MIAEARQYLAYWKVTKEQEKESDTEQDKEHGKKQEQEKDKEQEKEQGQREAIEAPVTSNCCHWTEGEALIRS